MKKALAGGMALLLVGWAALAVDLSGTWTTQMAFTSGVASPSTIFTLRLVGSGWALTTAWDPALPELSSHTLVLSGSLGPLGIVAGASFHLSAPGGSPALRRHGDLALWSADGFTFRSGFVSFDLALGNLTLQLTLHRGPGE